MYIELVRRVIEEAVELHVASSQESLEEVLDKVDAHIEATSHEYRRDEPKFNMMNRCVV